jgi:hypothetical protein
MEFIFKSDSNNNTSKIRHGKKIKNLDKVHNHDGGGQITKLKVESHVGSKNIFV